MHTVRGMGASSRSSMLWMAPHNTPNPNLGRRPPHCRHPGRRLRMRPHADEAHMPATTLPNVMCYETLLAAAASRLPFRWLATDEEAACGLCYTSGTTGNPKVRERESECVQFEAERVCMQLGR